LGKKCIGDLGVPPGAGDALPPPFEGQLEAVLAARPAVLSTIMGLLTPAQAARLRDAGIAWWATVTTVAEARAAGFRRLSLETGVQPTFVAARALYARSGFVECGPFEGYGPDPNSVFMTRQL
jgi:hypothetical protein